MKRFFQLAIILLVVVGCQNKKPTADDVKTASTPISSTSETPDTSKKDADRQTGSIENPIKFYFTPSVSEQVIKESANDISKFLQKETGYHFKIVIPKNYDQMINDFGNKNADVAIMNSFSYLVANRKYGAKAKLRTLRYGKSTYQGQIIANINSRIKSIDDLENKRFAFTDSSSTSGFLFPNQMIEKNNVSLKSSQFYSHHDEVVRMVYLGKVDAGATFYSEPSIDGKIRDARSRVKNEFPDVESKVKIIALTEPIPNDPVVFNKNLEDEIVNKLLFAIMKYAITDQGKMILGDLYGTEGFVRCSDMDYLNMKEVINTNGLNLSTLL